MANPVTKVGTTEAAQILGIHPGTVLDKAKAGQIPAEFTSTGRAIFERADIEALASATAAKRAGGR